MSHEPNTPGSRTTPPGKHKGALRRVESGFQGDPLPLQGRESPDGVR